MRMMRTCLDVARIDAELIIHADVAADSSALLAHALAEPACDETVSNSSLLLGSFDCAEALPGCMMDCAELSDDQGKDASGLSGFASGAACTAEWWFHSWLVNLAACAVVYLLANGGRVLFVWGLVRLLWDQLNTGLFAFVGTCDARGEGTYDEAVLAGRIRGMLGSLKATGGLMIFAAAVMQVPWVARLIWVVPEVAYTSLT